jgi:hypothetical protein
LPAANRRTILENKFNARPLFRANLTPINAAYI